MPLQLGLWEESNQCSWLRKPRWVLPGLLESLWDLLQVPRGPAVLTVHLAMLPTPKKGWTVLCPCSLTSANYFQLRV